MPRSRVRKKQVYTPPTSTTSDRTPVKFGSPVWLAPAMVAMFVIGLLWIVLYYIAGNSIPGIRTLGVWNIVVGFVFIGSGFVLSTKWR